MSDNKFKNFLVNGFQSADEKKEEAEPEEDTGEEYGEEAVDDCEAAEDPVPETAQASDGCENALRAVNDELLKMRYILEDIRDSEPEPVLMPDMDKYLTTREQMRAVTQAVERKDAEAANRNQIRTLEQVAVMREDFAKLCKSMRSRLDSMSAEDILSSFEAYGVDMENILIDGGVFIGAFPYDRLNTLHQRIVDVIPTDDESKNGMIAERLSDGYKIGNKVIMKEKVAIYKFTEKAKEQSEAEEETVSETTSSSESEENDSETKEETE